MVKIEHRADGFPSVSRVEFEDEDDLDDESHVVNVSWGIRWALDMFFKGDDEKTIATLAWVIGDTSPTWQVVERIKEIRLESFKSNKQGKEDKEVFEALVAVYDSAKKYKELFEKQAERRKKAGGDQ